jgi:hypothetical protein
LPLNLELLTTKTLQPDDDSKQYSKLVTGGKVLGFTLGFCSSFIFFTCSILLIVSFHEFGLFVSSKPFEPTSVELLNDRLQSVTRFGSRDGRVISQNEVNFGSILNRFKILERELDSLDKSAREIQVRFLLTLIGIASLYITQTYYKLLRGCYEASYS